MATEKKKDGRGGRREGAGRPGSGSRLITFRAPGPMASVIEAQENKTAFLKTCVSRYISEESLPKISEEPYPKKPEESLSQRLGDVYPASRVDEMELPFFDISVAAGFPIPLDNDEKAQSIGLLKMLCPHEESSYLIRVKGNSMIDAGIRDGDIVIVDKSNRNPSESEVAVCEFNGEYTLKRFVRRGDEGWLVPANPEFPEIKVTASDDFSVWGTVTYIIHKPVL